LFYLLLTIVLAVVFTCLQATEYVESSISISDGVYGSTFYMMTGFHGFHVIIGTIFLIVCACRIVSGKFSIVHFVGLECAIWYWHFVDVVWLFLYLFVYCWGNGMVPEVDLSIFEQQVVAADYADCYYQLDFQDSASFLMESIVDLHNFIMFYLWMILALVTWVLFAVCCLNESSKTGYILRMFYFFVHEFRRRAFIRRVLFFIRYRGIV